MTQLYSLPSRPRPMIVRRTFIISTGARRDGQSGEICSASNPQTRRNARFWLILPAILLGILALSPLVLNAQKVELSELTVNVTDQVGAIIPGATVSAIDAATGQRAAAITNGEGSAVLTLESGNYELSAQSRGFLEGRKKLDFPRVNLVNLALMVSNLAPCGPCVEPMPWMSLETTQPVVTALVEPNRQRWSVFHRRSSDAPTQKGPQ
jgi:hypothetical protein